MTRQVGSGSSSEIMVSDQFPINNTALMIYKRFYAHSKLLKVRLQVSNYEKYMLQKTKTFLDIREYGCNIFRKIVILLIRKKRPQKLLKSSNVQYLR